MKLSKVKYGTFSYMLFSYDPWLVLGVQNRQHKRFGIYAGYTIRGLATFNV